MQPITICIPSTYLETQPFTEEISALRSKMGPRCVRMKEQAPYHYCAPERLHSADPSLASDMWSYMCLFAALYLDCNAFYGNGGRVDSV